MKKLNYLLSAVVLLAVLATVGCSKDEPGPSAEEQVTEKFSKTWLLSSASYADQPVTDLAGFTLTVNSNLSYSSGTAARTPHPWPSSGTWAFTTPITDASVSPFKVTREDGLEINVTLTDTTMILTFDFIEGTHSQNGRDEGIAGSWSMEFAAQ